MNYKNTIESSYTSANALKEMEEQLMFLEGEIEGIKKCIYIMKQNLSSKSSQKEQSLLKKEQKFSFLKDEDNNTSSVAHITHKVNSAQIITMCKDKILTSKENECSVDELYNHIYNKGFAIQKAYISTVLSQKKSIFKFSKITKKWLLIPKENNKDKSQVKNFSIEV